MEKEPDFLRKAMEGLKDKDGKSVRETILNLTEMAQKGGLTQAGQEKFREAVSVGGALYGAEQAINNSFDKEKADKIKAELLKKFESNEGGH